LLRYMQIIHIEIINDITIENVEANIYTLLGIEFCFSLLNVNR